MKPTTPLQSIIDPFVTRIGGELVSDLIVGNKNELPSNADYLLRRHNVIMELKALEANTFNEALRRKFGDRMGNWHRQGRVMVYGKTRMVSGSLPLQCQGEMFDVMATSLQKHVVRSANIQIRSTKELLRMPDAKGLLWVASDGNEDLQPDAVWYLLMRIFQKASLSSEHFYSSIHGVAYFNPRMLAEIPGCPHPALFFWTFSRQPDKRLEDCFNELSDAWRQYVAWAQGITVRDVGGQKLTPRDVRFMGVKPRMPEIKINYGDSN